MEHGATPALFVSRPIYIGNDNYSVCSNFQAGVSINEVGVCRRSFVITSHGLALIVCTAAPAGHPLDWPNQMLTPKSSCISIPN